MTDSLIERLRSTRADMLGTDDEQHYVDCHEAADEIERLRAAIEFLIADDASTKLEAADEIERLTAELKLYRTGEAYSLAATEIERLTALLEHGRRPGKSNLPYIAEIKRLGEITALEEALEEAHTEIERLTAEHDHVMHLHFKQCKDVQRLRKALEKIAGWEATIPHPIEIASEALKDE